MYVYCMYTLYLDKILIYFVFVILNVLFLLLFYFFKNVGSFIFSFCTDIVRRTHRKLSNF